MNFKHLIIPLKLLQVSLLFTLFLDKNAALKPVNVTLHIGLHAQAGRSWHAVTLQSYRTRSRYNVTYIWILRFNERHYNGRFPFIRTGWPDHSPTSQFENEIDFFQVFLLKNHLFGAYYLGFD